MTKPKLLIAADTYHPKKDGVVRFLKEILPRLSKHFHLTLIVPNFEHKKIETKKGLITTIKLPVSKIIKITGYQAVKYTFKNKQAIRKQVQEADYVFVQDLGPIGSWAIKYAQKLKKPTLTYIHQINWEQLPQLLPKPIRFFSKIIIKKFSLKKYNQCNSILIPYTGLGSELETSGLKNRIEVVHLGVDSDFFEPSQNKNKNKSKIKIDPNRTVISYVGRISDEKNLEVLLETFKIIQDQHQIYLLIVGGGDQKDIKKFEEVKNVRVTGFISDVVPYLQATDIFVMPSLTETTSLATLEAMACGLPVITTKVGFLQEYIIKNENGLLFPKGNVPNLKLQLKKLLDRPQLRKTLGKNARITAQSFSWDKTAEKIIEKIEKIK